MHFVCASDCGGRLADITQLDFFEFNFASLLAPTDGLCSLASASAGMCVAAEQVAKQSVVEIAARVRMQNLARLGMHGTMRADRIENCINIRRAQKCSVNHVTLTHF